MKITNDEISLVTYITNAIIDAKGYQRHVLYEDVKFVLLAVRIINESSKKKETKK